VASRADEVFPVCSPALAQRLGGPGASLRGWLGSLVRLGTAVVRPEGRYNVLVPARRRIHAMRDLFVEWLARRLGA
jgi:hypothetical protein